MGNTLLQDKLYFHHIPSNKLLNYSQEPSPIQNLKSFNQLKTPSEIYKKVKILDKNKTYQHHLTHLNNLLSHQISMENKSQHHLKHLNNPLSHQHKIKKLIKKTIKNKVKLNHKFLKVKASNNLFNQKPL